MRWVEISVAAGLTVATSAALLGLSWYAAGLGAPEPALRPGALVEVQGRVHSIQPDGSQLSVETDRRTIRLRIDGATTVLVGGRRQGISVLSVGDPVCATYEPGEGVAHWVEPCPLK
jgi:hypothetical protein